LRLSPAVMQKRRNEWIVSIKAIEAEHLVAFQALAALRARLRKDPNFLKDVELSDLKRAERNLEGTYLIRLFAVFEAGLREAWLRALGRDTQPPMRDLLDGIASSRRIENKVLSKAHRVREFRNTLVHEQDEAAESSSLSKRLVVT
jgi:hypothetical protein